VIRKHLQQAGFTKFNLVTDSSKALQAIEQAKPDVILLDLLMPVNGIEILKKIRASDPICNTPVLTLTSNDDEITRTTLLNLGASDFINKPVSSNELVARVRNTLSSKIAFDQMASRSAQLQADVLLDSLTGISNRRAFDFELNRKMIEWERQRTPIALLLLDIDHFKHVNDKYGHQAGDHALKKVAETILQCTRRMDLVCRVGGEEFAVILPVTRTCESNQAAERIRTRIEKTPIQFNDITLELTVSIGIANAMKGDDANLLFRRADTSLYAGKQRGRNCSTLHDGAKCVAIEHAGKDSIDDAKLTFKDPVDLNITACSVMIVDDEPSTVAVVKKYLSMGGFERLATETDSTQVFERIFAETPDLVLMDIRMPNVDGLTVLGKMRANDQTRKIPVVILTSTTDTNTKVKALNLGANDFLNKPVNSSELLARVRNTLMAKAHVDLLSGYSEKLEHEVQLRTAELVASRREAIQCLARAAEMRDDKTGHHVIRVGRYAAIIAAELGFSVEQIVDLEHAAQLHDVGKIGVPDAILNKPDRLTPEEFEQIKDHCRAGSRIIRDDSRMDEHEESLSQIGDFLSECSSPVMRLAALVAESHHEKWDGSGYPRGLSGEEIPIEGRITAVCDVFDAVSTSRPYKKAYPLEKCFQIIAEGRDAHFDPTIVDAFFRRRHEIIEAYKEYYDNPTEE
jgi:putative two-component system response regulator